MRVRLYLDMRMFVSFGEWSRAWMGGWRDASFADILQPLPLNYILYTSIINILDFEDDMSSGATIQHCSCSTKQP